MFPKFLARASLDVWKAGRHFLLLDLALVLTCLLLIFSHAVVFWFHLIFFLLSLGAFYWKLSTFLERSGFCIAIVSSMVILSVFNGQLDIEELVEIPMLTTILVLVFVIAQRRRAAEAALRRNNRELESRIAERTRALSRINDELAQGLVEAHRTGERLRKLSSVVEQTDDIVVITNRRGIIEYVNPSFEHRLGYRREEVIGRTPRILKSGQHPRSFYRHLWETILSGNVYAGTIVNKKKDGSLYFEEKIITPLRDEKGTITHFVSTGRDITERVQSEKKLRHIARKNQAILNAIPDSMFHLNRAGDLLDYKVAETDAMLPRITGNAHTATLQDFLPRSLVPIILRHIGDTLDSGQMQVLEYHLPTAVGARDYEIRLVVYGREEVLAIVRDITERKKRAAALEEERNRIFRDLHDGLAQVLGYLRLKLDGLTIQPAVQQEASLQTEIEQARETANEAYELVRNMLAASRPANTADFASALLAQARTEGNRAGFKVHLTADGQAQPLPPVVQHQVLYLFQEGLANISKHAHAKNVDIHLTWTNDALTITLHDDGCGFDPTRPQPNGHFGLTIMHERAAEVDGRLTIHSQPGRGTTLSLWLPLLSVPQSATGTAVPAD